MRLLNTRTLKVEEFLSDVIPSYAILSHTWAEEEVSFLQIQTKECRKQKGFEKIRLSCRQARKDKHDWIWIDTCCIDKTSSAELSEAINSMWAWYYNAEVCYIYLVDLDLKNLPAGSDTDLTENPTIYELVRHCRWFKRGWTLQELLASSKQKFFDNYWRVLVDEDESQEELHEAIATITRIPKHCIQQRSWITSESVATKMTWAADRRCTRIEDTAYCLMGLFNITMPLLYGEGNKAFIRLQQEIWNSSDDQSLLCWSVQEGDSRAWGPEGAFATFPEDFQSSTGIQLFGNEMVDPGLLTKQGLPLRTILTPASDIEIGNMPGDKIVYNGTLNCGYIETTHMGKMKFNRIMIRLLPAVARKDPFHQSTFSDTNACFVRIATPFLESEPEEEALKKVGMEKQQIYIRPKATKEDENDFGLGQIAFSTRESGGATLSLFRTLLRDKSEVAERPWWVSLDRESKVLLMTRPYGDKTEFGTTSFRCEYMKTIQPVGGESDVEPEKDLELEDEDTMKELEDVNEEENPVANLGAVKGQVSDDPMSGTSIEWGSASEDDDDELKKGATDLGQEWSVDHREKEFDHGTPSETSLDSKNRTPPKDHMDLDKSESSETSMETEMATNVSSLMNVNDTQQSDNSRSPTSSAASENEESDAGLDYPVLDDLDIAEVHVAYFITRDKICFLLRPGLPGSGDDEVEAMTSEWTNIALTKTTLSGSSATLTRVLPKLERGTGDDEENMEMADTELIWGPPSLTIGRFTFKLNLGASSRTAIKKPFLHISIILEVEVNDNFELPSIVEPHETEDEESPAASDEGSKLIEAGKFEPAESNEVKDSEIHEAQ